MPEKTLNAYLHLLKPKQLDFILAQVRQFGDCLEVHRGTLPFLPVSVAASSLRAKLLSSRMDNLPQDIHLPSIGERFIREILTVIEMPYEPLKQKVSTSLVTLMLSDAKLGKYKGNHFQDKITLKFAFKPTEIIVLQKAGKNLWNVKTTSKISDQATTWLAENFR